MNKKQKDQDEAEDEDDAIVLSLEELEKIYEYYHGGINEHDFIHTSTI